MTTPWYVDNTRHTLGFVCPFARYLKFHHHGQGYQKSEPSVEIRIGSAVHANVERALMWLQQGGTMPDKPQTEAKFERDTVPGSEDTVTALTHGYVRLVLPWLASEYEIVAVEPEMTLQLGDDIHWMARPDAVVRHKQTKLHSIVELKTIGAQPEKMAAIYKHSLQTLMNSAAVRQLYGDCSETQIHIMQRGSSTWPTPLTHAYYRVGQPPFVTDDWQPKSKRADGSWLGKLYRKVRVSEHRALPDWIWSMPEDTLADYVPIIRNPLDQDELTLKYNLAVTSILKVESQWRDTVSCISKLPPTALTGEELSHHVPRSFACVQYQSECDFYSVCFNPHTQTHTLDITDLSFVLRQPHHTQEILDHIVRPTSKP